MHLVFLGPPASGKGTLSRILADSIGAIPISTGVMLRQHVTDQSELGRRAAVYMEACQLVPDELVNGMLSCWFEKHGDEHWILDGFPRTVDQAEWLKSELEARDISLDLAVSLDVSKGELLRRIRRRVQCASCGLTTALDLVDNELQCPECGGLLEPRRDDVEENFHRRYDDFERLTKPVIEFYAAQGKLMSLQAEGNPTEVCLKLQRDLLK